MTTDAPRSDLPPGPAAPPPGVRTMALVRWALVVVMAVVAAGSVLSYFGAVSSRAEGPGHAHRQLYTCPMHPQVVQDQPGQCPICSMTLVPKPEVAIKPPTPSPAGAAAAVPGLAPVDIPEERVQRIGMRTARVARAALAHDLRTVGSVQANERGLHQVVPRSAGWIESLLVSETGQRVKRGQPLATVYSPDILQAQQDLLTALGWTSAPPAGSLPHHAELASPDAMVTDARRRLELLGVAPQEIVALEKNRKVERALPLRSPADGYVIDKRAVAGMSVSPGASLFAIADLSTVWVIAEVQETDISRVRIGQPASFQASAYPGETFNGKLQFVAPTVDSESRTLPVRVEFRNRPGPAGLKLRPGMFGNLSLTVPATAGLFVPAEALVDTGDVQYVFVATSPGHFEPRRVKVGARAGDNVQVVSGVAEGDSVVTTANFLIDSESRLRAATEGAAVTPAPGR